ncbi:probable membrane-associated kinase regulator 4 [Oryza brachyantha]|uniref:Membrane-associated kinase regulator 4 n=1 Tax=Oryza brachyantha TaxID=4533 RepID=J3M7X2_ORYBR|nr:probable membrane-associated kinase regulator 4 [Oryza brachyantha]
MASKQQLVQEATQEEEYIDMDLTSAASAAAAPGEFEFHFHMSGPLGRGWEQESLASPADELFYKGKLLPLHLPPRIQMVEELLDGRVGVGVGGGGRGGRRALGISTAPATPYDSCTASPANSCYASGELNVEEYFQEYAARLADAAAAACEKKPWSRKLRFMRQLNLGHKLKASKAYIKTIFAAKPGSSGDDKGAVLGGATREAKELSHVNGHGHHHHRAWRRNPFGQTRSNRCIASQSAAAAAAGGGGVGKPREREHGHRRSFSSVIVRYSASNKTSPSPPPSCSSSSSSSSSKSFTSSSSVRSSSDSDGGAAPALRRSSSASSEVENPIQGLIAYCKKSQQLASVRKSASDAGFRFLSSAASKIAAESDGLEELVEICRA